MSEELLAAFLADPEGLPPEDQERLLAWLDAEPAAAARLKDLLAIEELASRALAPERGDFLNGWRKRLRNERSEKFFVKRVVTAAEAPRRRWRWMAPLAAAALIAVAVTSWATLSRREPAAATSSTPAVAAVASLRGAATVERGGVAVAGATSLAAADRVTAAASGATIAYADGTELTLAGGALVLVQPTSSPGKSLRLERGELQARVAPQPAGAPLAIVTPQARAEVVGTVFTLSVDQGRTRLAVDQGVVRLIAGESAVAVRAEHWAEAGPGIALAERHRGPPRILLITRDAQSDPLTVDRLRRAGYAVTVEADTAARAAEADAQDAVLISENVEVAKVDPAFRDVRVPVMVWECGLWPPFGLVRLGGEGVRGQQELRIVDPTHPLAAGLNGTVRVADEPTWLGDLITNQVPNAHIIAVPAPPIGGQASLFAYEAGEPLADGRPAPARRVGFFMYHDSEQHLTADGWKLFDAAVAWCAGPAR